MWWCQFIDLLKCKTRPSSLNFGTTNCAYTNENSENSNQKAIAECGVFFKQKSSTIISFIAGADPGFFLGGMHH